MDKIKCRIQMWSRHHVLLFKNMKRDKRCWPEIERHTCCTRPSPPRWDGGMMVMMTMGDGRRSLGGGNHFSWVFALTVRVLLCLYRQIRRRWPICAGRITGSLCLTMFRHFMGIKSHMVETQQAGLHLTPAAAVMGLRCHTQRQASLPATIRQCLIPTHARERLKEI